MPVDETAAIEPTTTKRQLESGIPDAETGEGGEAEEDPEAKRRRILEETRDIDADSEGSEEDDSSEEESDDEDEAAELMRELEKIKKERLAQKEKEVRDFRGDKYIDFDGLIPCRNENGQPKRKSNEKSTSPAGIHSSTRRPLI